jgi:hypothetical protein
VYFPSLANLKSDVETAYTFTSFRTLFPGPKAAYLGVELSQRTLDDVFVNLDFEIGNIASPFLLL